MVQQSPWRVMEPAFESSPVEEKEGDPHLAPWADLCEPQDSRSRRKDPSRNMLQTEAPNVESCPCRGQQRALPPPRPEKLQTDPSPLIGKLSHQSCRPGCRQAGSSVSVPAGESGLGRNVQAGPAGSVPPTLARDGGLGPFNV